MNREFAFDTPEQVRSFLNGLNQLALHGSPGGRSTNASLIPISEINTTAAASGGSPVFSSSRRKEVGVYDRQQIILDRDREYLYNRETTTRFLIDNPARDRWAMPPRTFNPTIDAFLAAAWSAGFGAAAMSADIAAARDGPGFLWIRTTNPNPTQPLQPGEKIIGFSHIRKADLDHQEPVMPAGRDPDHDIVGLVRVKVGSQEFSIDGSRIIDFGHDLERKTWKSTSVIDPIFDALWDMNDVATSAVRNQEQGNPLVVSLDTDQMMTWVMNPEAQAEIEDDMEILFDGATQIVGPTKGVTIKRAGKNDIMDPTLIADLVANRIAYTTPYTKNHILGNSRGSEQVTDADRLDYVSEMHSKMSVYNYRILARLIRLAKRMRMIPIRAPFDIYSIHWPTLRSLNERERAFVDKSDATTLKTCLQSGRIPPAHIAAKFPVNSEPIDPNLILPTVSVSLDEEAEAEPETFDDFQRGLEDNQ